MPIFQPRTVPTPAGTVFPAVHASNLNGRAVDLPGDFAGERNLVVLAFQREHQALVDSWSPAIANLLARYADLRFYELPTISRGNPLFRAWLDGAMRGGIPDRQAREHTITLYLDKAAFRQALDLPHEETIYILVLDQDMLPKRKTTYLPCLQHHAREPRSSKPPPLQPINKGSGSPLLPWPANRNHNLAKTANLSVKIHLV